MERHSAPWEPAHSAAYDAPRAPNAAAAAGSSAAAYAQHMVPHGWRPGGRVSSELADDALRGAAPTHRDAGPPYAAGPDLQQLAGAHMGAAAFDDAYAALQSAGGAARFGAPFAAQPGARMAAPLPLRPPAGGFPPPGAAPPMWPPGTQQVAAPLAYHPTYGDAPPAVHAQGLMGYADWQVRQGAYAGGRGATGPHEQQFYGAAQMGRPMPYEARGGERLSYAPSIGGMPPHLSAGGVTDLRSLQAALQEATPGTGQVAAALLSAAFPLRLPGLTAIMGRFTKQGRWAVSLEIFQVLPSLGLELDTTVCNAALAACMRGCVWHRAKQVFSLMLARGVRIDHITYYTMLSVPRRRKIWRVVIELFMHMCEADVPPLLPDCAALISSLAIDGKWLLAEKLFYYIFRHEAAFAPPPPLDQHELAAVATADLNLAFLLESATQQARAAYAPPQSPHEDAATVAARQSGGTPSAGSRTPSATLEAAPPPVPPPAAAGLGGRLAPEGAPPELAQAAQPAANVQQSLASLRRIYESLPQGGPGDDALGRRFSEASTSLSPLDQRGGYEGLAHGHPAGAFEGSRVSTEARVSGDTGAHVAPASAGISSASLAELTAGMMKLGVNPDAAWQGPAGAGGGHMPMMMPTQLQALGLHGEQSGPMHGELMCCNELIAAYTRLEKLERAAHLLRCMIEAGGAFAPSAETCNRFLFSAGARDV